MIHGDQTKVWSLESSGSSGSCRWRGRRLVFCSGKFVKLTNEKLPLNDSDGHVGNENEPRDGVETVVEGVRHEEKETEVREDQSFKKNVPLRMRVWEKYSDQRGVG